MTAGLFCPICRRYSDRYATALARDAHLLEAHPSSEEALLVSERRRKQHYGTPTGKATHA